MAPPKLKAVAVGIFANLAPLIMLYGKMDNDLECIRTWKLLRPHARATAMFLARIFKELRCPHDGVRSSTTYLHYLHGLVLPNAYSPKFHVTVQLLKPCIV